MFQIGHVNSIVNLEGRSREPSLAALAALYSIRFSCESSRLRLREPPKWPSVCGSEYRVEMHHIQHLKDIEAGKNLLDKLMKKHKSKQTP